MYIVNRSLESKTKQNKKKTISSTSLINSSPLTSGLATHFYVGNRISTSRADKTIHHRIQGFRTGRPCFAIHCGTQLAKNNIWHCSKRKSAYNLGWNRMILKELLPILYLYILTSHTNRWVSDGRYKKLPLSGGSGGTAVVVVCLFARVFNNVKSNFDDIFGKDTKNNP